MAPMSKATDYELIAEYADSLGVGHKSFDKAINFYPYLKPETQSNTLYLWYWYTSPSV